MRKHNGSRDKVSSAGAFALLLREIGDVYDRARPGAECEDIELGAEPGRQGGGGRIGGASWRAAGGLIDSALAEQLQAFRAQLHGIKGDKY